MSDSFTITGTVSSVDDVQTFSSFSKRTFALEIEDGKYPQVVAFELSKELDRITPLDTGRKVEITFNLRGRRSKKDGRVWNTLAVWKIRWLSGVPEQQEHQQEEPPPRPDRKPAQGSLPVVPAPAKQPDDDSEIPF